MIVSEGRTMGRRYQIVLVHSFEDAWDRELETIEARARRSLGAIRPPPRRRWRRVTPS